ncbi:MAG: class I SAM-dependent rRNA methyltransferase, partial [Spirochaetia bacterium]|nr:class I SAM-dependent rRNA methyltransferase [Spirochaetia bacterium]
MKVILKKGKEKSLLRKHPWVFSGAIESVQNNSSDRNIAELVNSNGQFLAIGMYSKQSQIRVRVLSFDKADIDRTFFKDRIYKSIERRQASVFKNSGVRLIFSESDLLPGLILDSYDGHFVVQYLSAPMDDRRNEINEILLSHPMCKSLFERSDSSSRSRESLSKRSGTIGKIEPPEFIEIQEDNLKFLVDVRNGHKTGFYLDQKNNRQLLLKYCEGREVLNCFSYTGGFGVSAAMGKAKKVINIDSSKDSLLIAQKNFELNKIKQDKYLN